MEENKRGQGIFLGVVGVATLVVAIIGATFAFFAASATNNTTIKGNTAASSNLGLAITKMDSATSGLIPMADSLAGKAVGATTSCVDDNGNAVCHVYDIELTNGKSPVMISGEVSFASYSNSNIVYDITFKDIADGDTEKNLAALSTEISTTTTGITYATKGTLATKTSYAADAVKHYYLVVWLHETGSAQDTTDAGKEDGYTGTVTFNAVDNSGNASGVTATFTS